jgi:phosphate-selective porin OprO/OprP
MKKHAIVTAALAALASATGVAASTTEASAQATTRWNGSPETREEDRRFHVNGRFMYDVAYTDADCANTGCTGVNESGVRSYVRRAFLGVDGRLTEHWRYNAKFDFSIGGSTNVDDFYLEYAAEPYSFVIGNHNAISPMEDRDSSLNIPFNERSFLITSGGFGKRPGIGFLTNGGNWSWGAALQGNDSLSTSDTAANGTESYFGISRFTWAPIYQNTPEGITLLHLAATLRYRDIGDGNANTFDGAMNYNPGGLSNKQGNNAQVGGFSSDAYLGGELAFQWHSFGMEAEYGAFSSEDITTGPNAAAQLGDADATGYYVDVFWSPTGESRRYNAADGSFGAVSPLRTLGSDGGIGHIMLSARYEDMDLTDSNFGANRNELTAYTLGATWVPIAHVKFQLNYSNTEVDYVTPDVPGTRVDNEIDAVTLRTQFDW